MISAMQRFQIWNLYRKNDYLTLQQALELPASEPLFVHAELAIPYQGRSPVDLKSSWRSTVPAHTEIVRSDGSGEEYGQDIVTHPVLQRAELILYIPHYERRYNLDNTEELRRVRQDKVTIDCAALPQELTLQMERVRILNSVDFRRFYDRELIKIVSPTKAKQLMATPEAKKILEELKAKDEMLVAAGARRRLVSVSNSSVRIGSI